MSKLPNNPHDALFHIQFEDPMRADPLIAASFPGQSRTRSPGNPCSPALEHGSVPTSPVIRPTSFTRASPPWRRGGGLYPARAQVPGRQEPSAPDPAVPVSHMGGLQEGNHRRREGKAPRAPAVVPLALHHGGRRWNHALSVAGMPEALRGSPWLRNRFCATLEATPAGSFRGTSCPGRFSPRWRCPAPGGGGCSASGRSGFSRRCPAGLPCSSRFFTISYMSWNSGGTNWMASDARRIRRTGSWSWER